MSQEKLKTALIGLDTDGLGMLKALEKVQHYEILALASKMEVQLLADLQ